MTCTALDTEVRDNQSHVGDRDIADKGDSVVLPPKARTAGRSEDRLPVDRAPIAPDADGRHGRRRTPSVASAALSLSRTGDLFPGGTLWTDAGASQLV